MIVRHVLLTVLLVLVLNGCTSKVDEGMAAPPAQTESKQGCEGKACATCDLPWGGTLAAGESTEESYSKSLVECTEECSAFKIKLTCVEGKLEAKDLRGQPFRMLPSLSKTCHVKRCDCTYGGTVVEDGNARDFYRMAAPSCGRKCEPRSFTCKAGKLLDTDAPRGASTISSYPQSSCTEVACKACPAPWGAMIAHGATTPAYKADVAGCNTSCAQNKVTLRCNDGNLSGGDTSVYKFAGCTARACQNCQLPSGDLLAHNATAPAYEIDSAACGTSCSAMSTTLKCEDGNITGGDVTKYKYNSCNPVQCKTCTLPCGRVLASGGEGFCFKAAAPSACGNTCLADRKKYSCLDGITKPEDGSSAAANAPFTFSTCNEGGACSSCYLPDGRKVLDGTKMTFFKEASLGCGKSCLTTANAITLTCSNGTFANQALYPDFKQTTCAVDCRTVEGDMGLGRVEGDGGGAPVVWCQIPWTGTWATHNSDMNAFSVSKPATGHKCSEYKSKITCNAYRGLWSGGGTYVYGMCKE